MADPITRREFLGVSVVAGAGIVSSVSPVFASLRRAPALITSERLRPQLPSGIQSGDVTDTRAVVWSRTDRPSRMIVEWATNDRFADAHLIEGPAALDTRGFTAALDLRDLPPGERIVYRVRFESLEHPGTFSEPLAGWFRTAPRTARPLRLAWSADCVGQGWGIDVGRGGLRMFETIRGAEPDVFVHSGDIIYADQPLSPEVPLDDGTLWRNLVTPEKSKVAETMDEFRGNFAYHLLDEHARRFHASVPMIAQWDDHEVVNNWFPGQMLEEDTRYAVKSVSLLAARAKQALFEFLPIRRHPDDAERIYRRFAYGPLLEIFVIDLRSYRGPNSPNRQIDSGSEAAMLGNAQLAWLKEALRSSTAVWKVIASDIPIGLVVSDQMRDGQPNYEGWANADAGPPLGRELEVADLLRHIQRERIRNTVWITGDVHYAAAHHYSPERAAFHEFDPFWEFVAGPMHAGTFGPNRLDGTFGPETRFASPAPSPNRPPSDGLQFFGTLDIEPVSGTLTAGLHDVHGRRLWSVDIPAEFV